ncbi:MAG: hypothetical protein AB1331_03785 [Bacillota bacterium]
MSEPIKIVFWDLDGTLWGGTLEEDADELTIPPGEVREVLLELDRRGILHSVISQAASAAAGRRLAEHGLDHLFLRPKYNVVSKAQAIAETLRELNLLPSNAAFIDDLPFYRGEVQQLLPEVLTLGPEAIPDLPRHPRFAIRSTLGSTRRELYRAEEQREQAELKFAGSRAEFLASCQMVLTCHPVRESDLARLHELFARTHRLSIRPAGGETASTDHGLIRKFVAELKDRFGDYGLVAGAAIHITHPEWNCRQLSISCRVQGRGVVEGFLAWLVKMAAQDDAVLSLTVSTASEVNQPLRTALRLAGFAPADKGPGWERLVPVRPERLGVPEWIRLEERP